MRRPTCSSVELIRGRGGQGELVAATERGRADEIVRVYAVSDVFGLARICFQRSNPTPVTILPSVGEADVLTALIVSGCLWLLLHHFF